jgi:hypothetical protein
MTQKHPLQFYAELESELIRAGVPIPKPWPWAINSDGTSDMALRCLQLLELVEETRAAQQLAENFATGRLGSLVKKD